MRHYRSDLLPIPTCLLVPTIPCFFRGILERRPCKAVDMGPSCSAWVCSFSEAAMQHYNGHNGYGSMSSSYPAGSGPTGCRFRWIPEPGISVAPQRPRKQKTWKTIYDSISFAGNTQGSENCPIDFGASWGDGRRTSRKVEPLLKLFLRSASGDWCRNGA
jgi:hypothetical protein